jgi:hypothetical protein
MLNPRVDFAVQRRVRQRERARERKHACERARERKHACERVGAPASTLLRRRQAPTRCRSEHQHCTGHVDYRSDGPQRLQAAPVQDPAQVADPGVWARAPEP